jgi:hypothetical protein
MFVRHSHRCFFVSMALEPVFVYLFCTPFVPLFRWLSGHSRAPGDTEGHKTPASLSGVYDFVRKLESFEIVCEASALPLSQAGLESITYKEQWTSQLAVSLLKLNAS